jgi:tRNA-splicing ligase RtcB
MYVYKPDYCRVPVKVWSEKGSMEEECIKQIENAASLPFAHHHVSLMPDGHTGIGAPIGGVLATKGVIIPNFIGVDIGCGMCFLQTNIPSSLLRETKTPDGTLLENIIGTILRNIPTGFAHHSEAKECGALARAEYDMTQDHDYHNVMTFADVLLEEIHKGYFQVGTLGGGNHFIELQEDENGMVAIMLHSGSRNFGYKVCKFFNDVAKNLNERWYSSVPSEWQLSFLPLDTIEGRSYKAWMDLALEFAMQNRGAMMLKVQEIFFNLVKKHTGFEDIKFSMEVNAHHNYAAMEHHYGKNVMVHRKGAIRVREGELGIIPGAMGSYSYIVEGLGNPESFYSCSHGAGRQMSRIAALEKFTTQEVMEDLNEQGVVLGKHNKKDVAEECRGSYKDIDFVISQELDLIKPIKKLKTIGVVKG